MGSPIARSNPEQAMSRFGAAILLLVIALPGHAAERRATRDPAFDFVAGRYALVGRQPDDGATYAGSAVIAITPDGFTLERTIGAIRSVATGAVEVPSPPGEGKVLRFRSAGKDVQLTTCLVMGDLDNYGRLSCVWVPENHAHATPGLEAYFSTEAWPPG